MIGKTPLLELSNYNKKNALKAALVAKNISILQEASGQNRKSHDR